MSGANNSSIAANATASVNRSDQTSSGIKQCFNPYCLELESRKGWRLRSGEYAHLCDRCAWAYEEGRFCETFHGNAGGWRSCESCGKRVHCGCIVSIHCFIMLDVGGIQCIACATQNLLLTSNPAWPPPVSYSASLREKLKDLSGKALNPLMGLGSSVPWLQTPTLSNSSTSNFELRPRMLHHEVDRRNDNQKLARHSSSSMEDPSSPHFRMAVLSLKDTNRTSASGVDDQIWNGRPQYWPLFSDEEIQHISPNSNSVLTPLFEKMLSASDVGRIGRLVLPKKCAEAYFPPICQPEGLPLKVQDSKGKEWIFQFRFWPNNKSRMYVLEGVTPCIQNMQLQAGDTVTFSRSEPEGKLIMGYRKPSAAPQVHQDELADPTSWSKIDESLCVAKDAECKTPVRKRKSSTLGSKSKRLRIDNEDMKELKLTWEEVQGLLRPPPEHVPRIVVIEGFEFEEYEDAPVLGRPTIFMTDYEGHEIQWVQCEDCRKWRKLPADALLPSKWTCSCNSWDPERSLCSAVQELTAEELEDLLPSCNIEAASKELRAAKREIDDVNYLEGLNTFANSAASGEGEAISASSQATTKHPRHRPGCSCIVCIQPPSGWASKHKQTCTCNVCQTTKRRFKTMMLRREKNLLEKDLEIARKPQYPLPENLLGDDEPLTSSDTQNTSPNGKIVVIECSDDDPNRMKSSTSPFKGQIDLNIQPEREESSSPGSDSGSTIKMLQDATQRYLKQKFSSSNVDNNSARNQTLLDGTITGEAVAVGITSVNIHHDSLHCLPTASSMKPCVSAPES